MIYLCVKNTTIICFPDLFELVPMRFWCLRIFLITPHSYRKEFQINSCLLANNLSLLLSV